MIDKQKIVKKWISCIAFLCCAFMPSYGANQTFNITFNSSLKPQNGITLSSGGDNYGTISCDAASSNRAIIKSTSSLTFETTLDGWTIKSITLTWYGSNAPTTDVLTLTGGTFNSVTSITGNATTVVLGSPNTNNNYQVSAVSVTFTNESGWVLRGEFDGWSDEGAPLVGLSGDVSVMLTLAANSRYEFKFKHGDDHYSNPGAIMTDISGWPFAKETVNNCTLYTGPAGDYVFTLNTSALVASVTYPTVPHPCDDYVYFIPGTGWSDVRIYCWEEGTENKISTLEGAPIVNTHTDICGQDYYYCAAYFDHVIFRDGGTNQTQDIVIERGKYIDERTHPSAFADFTTYTISFNAGEGTGTMTPITGICPNSNQALPINAFTKTGYVFDYWTADVDVTVGGNVITAGEPIASEVTLQSLNSNIVLTAHYALTFQYILGHCYLKNGVWTQGNDGTFSAWRYLPEEETLEATSDISYPSDITAAIHYFNTTDLTKLDNAGSWSYSSSSNRAIKAFKVDVNETVTFNLVDLQAAKITYYVFPASNDAYNIDLTTNRGSETKSITSGSQHKWHKFAYESGPYTGTFSITSHDKVTKCVVIVEVPKVTITFDSNNGSGATMTQSASKDEEVTLRENEFTRTDYRFAGWTLDVGGTGDLIADKALFSSSTDVTLYAQWAEIIRVNVILNGTGAFNKYTNHVTAVVGDDMPLIEKMPEKVGVLFEGYYSGENGTGTKYYNGLGGSVHVCDLSDGTTLYANWVDPCAIEPTLTNVIPLITIWDGKELDMGIVRLTCDFDTTGITYSLLSASENIPGCTFDYFDEQIHLVGKPTVGNSEVVTKTVTFTMTNNCSSSPTYSITTTIRIYPAGTKPKVAFIVTGTRGGGFDAYNAADRAACSELLDYLDDFYEITCVNGYATQDEADIQAYYEQYDLLIVTDFLNTKLGYTNALGTMIDKKPMLSFEAYVANQSNWHIGSNPQDPHPKVKTMKVLCAGHAVFKDDEGVHVINLDEYGQPDTTVTVLSALSSEKKAKGLQGFVINEAPDFVFLATIRDENNNRDLIVCCERQIVFPARLMLYGINFYEMGNLTQAGKIIMRQMIDYLLLLDETQVADCSLVFDDNNGTHVWSDPKNWYPGYNIIPTPFHGARIIAECHVDKDDAHAGSIKINKEGHDHSGVNGKLIIEPYGGLTVAGIVTKVNDTRYASPLVIKAEDLLIKADESNNGALVYGNKESDVRATVQYYSRGDQAKTANPVWQYMGIPFQAGQTAIDLYRDAWMCRWANGSTDGLGGLWQWVENEDVLLPFEGYSITQEAKKTYEFKGKLNSPVTTVIELDNYDKDGFAFAANSWTAPIKIQEMQDADFTNAEKSIYIYHSGTYADWTTYGTPELDATSTAATLPGQYAVIPIHSSPYLSGADSVIPAMQGFFVKKTNKDEEAKVRLVYNRVVYDATYFKTSTQPMRAPRRRGPAPQTMRLFVSGEASGGDHVYLLERSDFSENYEDGWDGRKIEGDPSAPMMAVVKEGGEMSVAAVSSFEERLLSFRAGADTEYTFHFDYDGEMIYLYDMLTGLATEIRTGNTYSFTATNKTPVERFLITANPPSAPTDIPAVEMESPVVRPQKYLDGDQIYILHGGTVYDIIGRRMMPVTGKEDSR